MRLLNRTLKIAEFHGHDVPQYAILSHVWITGETSYSEIVEATGAMQDSPGMQKILGALELARQDGYEWLWVDTCCIDKRSSAELSEAINSIYVQFANLTKFRPLTLVLF